MSFCLKNPLEDISNIETIYGVMLKGKWFNRNQLNKMLLDVKELNDLKPKIKHQIAQKTRHQLRKMPDLFFYNDDSLEYINRIEDAVKGDKDPVKNPDLLEKRKNL